MSDPAREAVDRAASDLYDLDSPEQLYSGARRGMTAAAREALNPVRSLHHPWPFRQRMCCMTCFDGAGLPVPWPCSTALFCYTTDEIEEMAGE